MIEKHYTIVLCAHLHCIATSDVSHLQEDNVLLKSFSVAP